MAVNLFGLIKKLNREIKYKVREGRGNLSEEKQSVDCSLLHLQNLMYEIKHLKKEIRQCYEFKSQDEDLDLMDDVKSDELTSNHSHRISCLEKELQLRKELSSNYKDLMEKRKETIGNINSIVERFSLFAPSLQTLLKATKPLHDALEMNIDLEWKLGKLVDLLPEPLYLAYINIHFKKMENNSDLFVTVVGNEEDVHNIERIDQIDHRRKHGSSDRTFLEPNKDVNNLEIQKMNMLKPHPLLVRFMIGNIKNVEECFTVNLRYFPNLGLVTASAEVNYCKTDEIVREVTTSVNILDYVIHDDKGDNLPFFEAQRMLNYIDMTPEDWLKYTQMEQYGKPYIWLQKVCYAKTDGIQNCEHQKTFKFVSNIIDRIKSLWDSRLKLFMQIKNLANKTFLNVEGENVPSDAPSCSLAQWASIKREEYMTSYPNSNLTDQNIADISNSFYRAVIVRGSAKMECLISISPQFPMETPIWAINIFWNGQHNAFNNSAVKLMEYWTNALCQEELKNDLAMLPVQLLRTMYSFDIYLETEGPYHDPNEYKKEKHYNKSFAKRIRARPYRFIMESFKQ